MTYERFVALHREVHGHNPAVSPWGYLTRTAWDDLAEDVQAAAITVLTWRAQAIRRAGIRDAASQYFQSMAPEQPWGDA
jgi:hypothetical protein